MSFFDDFVEEANTAKNKLKEYGDQEYEFTFTDRSLEELPQRAAGMVEGGLTFYQAVDSLKLKRQLRQASLDQSNRGDVLSAARFAGKFFRAITLGF